MSDEDATPTELVRTAHQNAQAAIIYAEACVVLARFPIDEWRQREGVQAIDDLRNALPLEIYTNASTGRQYPGQYRAAKDVERARRWLARAEPVTVGNITSSTAHGVAVELACDVLFRCQLAKEDMGTFDCTAAWEALRTCDPAHFEQCRNRMENEYLLALRTAEHDERQVQADAAKAGKRGRSPKKNAKGVSVDEANARMTQAMEDDYERVKWSARRWADSIGCSTSTIAKTPIWKQCGVARAKAKAERQQRNRGRRVPKHRSKAD